MVRFFFFFLKRMDFFVVFTDLYILDFALRAAAQEQSPTYLISTLFLM